MSRQACQRPWHRLRNITRRHKPLTTGLILPVLLAVGVLVGPGPKHPDQPGVHRPMSTGQVRSSRRHDVMSGGRCLPSGPSYRPGRVYARAGGGSQPGGPLAAVRLNQILRPPISHPTRTNRPGRGMGPARR